MGRGWLGYAANASDQAFFASAVCNTRLHKRSVNRVLSVIGAWFDGLAAILQTLIAHPILRNLDAKFTHNLWIAIFKFKLPFAI